MRIVLLTFSALALTACGSGDTVSVPDGEGGVATIKTEGENKATFTGADGKSVSINSGNAQADFPAHAPQYPGSSVESAATLRSDGNVSQTVTLLTSDQPQKVRDFYKASLEKAGKKINEMSVDGGFMLSTTEEPGSLITISADEDSGKTSVALILNSKE